MYAVAGANRTSPETSTHRGLRFAHALAEMTHMATRTEPRLTAELLAQLAPRSAGVCTPRVCSPGVVG